MAQDNTKSSDTIRGFELTGSGLQIPGPHTNAYMIPTIDAPVFDRRSSADHEPRLPSDPLSAVSYVGGMLLKAALGEGKAI